MKKQTFVDGLAVAAALVIILGVGSAAKSAFADPVDLNLKTTIPTSPKN
ncbi:MAG: hypothetical protein GWN47_03730 [Woeseiaceae bacterium]|nr:hypothetical protein [Woeseiaceae bacterium]